MLHNLSPLDGFFFLSKWAAKKYRTRRVLKKPLNTPDGKSGTCGWYPLKYGSGCFHPHSPHATSPWTSRWSRRDVFLIKKTRRWRNTLAQGAGQGMDLWTGSKKHFEQDWKTFWTASKKILNRIKEHFEQDWKISWTGSKIFKQDRKTFWQDWRTFEQDQKKAKKLIFLVDGGRCEDADN